MTGVQPASRGTNSSLVLLALDRIVDLFVSVANGTTLSREMPELQRVANPSLI